MPSVAGDGMETSSAAAPPPPPHDRGERLARSDPMDIEHYLTDPTRDSMREAIRDAGGNEVFFVGRLDDDGRIAAVEVHCRGGPSAVPALLHVPRAGEVVLHNHPSGELQPSDADLSLAARYGQDGVGFFIVDNDLRAIYAVVEAHRSTRVPLDHEAIVGCFTPDGGLSGLHPEFEHRLAQEQMARAIAQTIDDDGIAVVEAGTGIGKSIAYLVPLAHHAKANRVRVVVSTGSINLQQQLVNQDIPLVRQLVGVLSVALVKGRGNYLCRRKLAYALANRGEYDEAEQRFLDQVAGWAITTADGSLADLTFVPNEELWSLVRSDADQTLRSRCPHFQDCFYYQARRQAAAADLLIVNHHLLMVDLDLKHALGDVGVLPRYQAVVVDEAHHLEEVASSLLATRVTPRGIEQLLGRLIPKHPRRRGLLARLVARLPAGIDATERIREIVQGSVSDAVARIRVELPPIAEDLQRILEEHGGGGGEAENTYRLPDRHDSIPVPLRGLVDHAEVLASLLADVSDGIGRMRRLLEAMPVSWQDDEVQLALDLRSVHERLGGTLRSLAALLSEERDICRWVELSRGKQVAPRLCTCPIDVSPLIRERLFDAIPAVALTSATLTVDRRFDFLCGRVGLAGGTLAHERMVTARLPSPFDFRSQVLLCLPSGALPEPRDPRHGVAVEDLVCRIAEAARGRTFVLFTSYHMLHQVHTAASERLEGFRLLAQGTMERSRLLDAFRSGPRAVLLGTDSFWEGVDVPGAALSCVVLTRLPFRVPTEPVTRARAELIERRGGDAFQQYSVPQAVIRFRQGFGRLIRSRADRGAVVVLDPRLVSRSYGRVFLGSLPTVDLARIPFDRLGPEIRRFLDGD